MNHWKNRCDNCDWTGDDDALACTTSEIPNLAQRIDPGGVVPSGECPECGCLAYPPLPPLTLAELMSAAAGGYDQDDNGVGACFDEATGEILPTYADCGDGLAAFVAVELVETFDATLTRERQIEEAVRVLRRAQDDLQRTIDAIEAKET